MAIKIVSSAVLLSFELDYCFAKFIVHLFTSNKNTKLNVLVRLERFLLVFCCLVSLNEVVLYIVKLLRVGKGMRRWK